MKRAPLHRNDLLSSTAMKGGIFPTTNGFSKCYVGSHDTRIIRQDVLDALPNLERYAARLLNNWNGEARLKAGRWIATPADFAQFFAVMLAVPPTKRMPLFSSEKVKEFASS
jgi:hypothetical protein